MSVKRRSRLVIYTVALLAAFLVAGLIVFRTGESDVFSPGQMARAHGHLVGEAHCADCHVGSKGLSNTLCLDCHTTLATRIERKEGFHAGIGDAKCDSCHAEHRGADAQLIRWPAPDEPYKPIQLGKAKREEFPHAKTTSFPLEGAHAKLECGACHKQSLIADQKVIDFVKGEETFLGVPKECGACHVDAHAPTLGNDCAKCHDARAWKPAATFQHGETRYPLVGKHEPVACAECHRVETTDAQPAAASRPLPTFEAIPSSARPRPFRGVGFGTVEPVRGDALPACRACHENPHRKSSATTFGRCEDCHTPRDWKNQGQVATGAAFDHSTTGFVLDGAHATEASCVDCHGPRLDLAARTSCRDCHEDDEQRSHKGAFDREMAMAPSSCDMCHSTAAWKPSTYVPSRHNPAVPLTERHAIKCEDCHGTEKHTFPRLAPRSPTEAAKWKVGPMDSTCVACHIQQDVHQGKLGRDCEACHDTKGFILAQLSVEKHAEIGFPIRDAHLKASCEGCHGQRTPGGGLRQLALSQVKTEGCFACHGEPAPPVGKGDDPHRGQLNKDCASCHTEVRWNPSTYDDARHQAARLPLQGAHKAVPCEACHVREVPPGPPLQQRFHWDTAAMRCDQCHNQARGDDPHQGQFGKQDCATCHVQEAWLPSTFSKSAHAATGFPLAGNHDRECGACHLPVPGKGKFVHFASTPRECAACHVDPHLGQFAGRGGQDGCGRCHGLVDWRPSRFDHDRLPTRFPLTGKHREVECTACHVASSRQFPDGQTRDVIHYFPIEGRACDTCHQNPHAPRRDQR